MELGEVVPIHIDGGGQPLMERPAIQLNQHPVLVVERIPPVGPETGLPAGPRQSMRPLDVAQVADLEWTLGTIGDITEDVLQQSSMPVARRFPQEPQDLSS